MHALDTATVAYEDDLYAWTREQAELLRARRADLIDWDHLAEEIDAMAGRDRRELESRLRVIITHLLKWQVQPQRRGASWRKTLRTQRREIRLILKQSPSLRREVPLALTDAFPDAIKEAVEETSLPPAPFPRLCPYTAEQVLDEDWLPDGTF